MKNQPIYLEPVFKTRIWGGSKLKEAFGYHIPTEHTGECWAISAHPNGQSIVKNGKLTGLTLGEIWDNHRELFGNHPAKSFPLLTKILDANTDLSVQVHPDDEYANKNENGELGKTECWYIIDCNEDAELIYGHNAKSRKELIDMIDKGQWNELLRKVSIKPGDFFYVPSGTIHALCEGTLVLETQQSSDTTYRVYDYERTDQEGNKRELHLEKAIEVTTVPYVDGEKSELKVDKREGATVTTFVKSDYFTVQKWDINGESSFIQDQPFMLVSILNGKGDLKKDSLSFPIQKNEHFILPHKFGRFTIEGQIEAMVSF